MAISKQVTVIALVLSLFTPLALVAAGSHQVAKDGENYNDDETNFKSQNTQHPWHKIHSEDGQQGHADHTLKEAEKIAEYNQVTSFKDQLPHFAIGADENVITPEGPMHNHGQQTSRRVQTANYRASFEVQWGNDGNCGSVLPNIVLSCPSTATSIGTYNDDSNTASCTFTYPFLTCVPSSTIPYFSGTSWYATVYFFCEGASRSDLFPTAAVQAPVCATGGGIDALDINQKCSSSIDITKEPATQSICSGTVVTTSAGAFCSGCGYSGCNLNDVSESITVLVNDCILSASPSPAPMQLAPLPTHHSGAWVITTFWYTAFLLSWLCFKWWWSRTPLFLGTCSLEEVSDGS